MFVWTVKRKTGKDVPNAMNKIFPKIPIMPKFCKWIMEKNFMKKNLRFS